MAEMGVMLVFVLLVASVSQCLAASSLIPLIGWSNRDVLQSVKVADNPDVNGFTERLHLDGIDTVVVFRTTELSFDDIVQLGGSFGGTNQKFGRLEKSVVASKSSLWAGVTGDFVQALALHMGTSAQTFSGKSGQAIPTTSKLVLVELEGGFGDSTVGSVMGQLENKKTSYVAFYTSTKPTASRQARAAATTNTAAAEYTCLPNYGVVFAGTDGKTCMLFCLTDVLRLTVKNNGSSTVVNATDSTAYVPSFYNSSSTTTSGVPATVNQCSLTSSDNLVSNAAIGFQLNAANATFPPITNVTNVTNLKFAFTFPINSGAAAYPNAAAYKYFWTMVVCVSGTYAGNNNFYTVLSRAPSPDNTDNELYVPQTNSYACSSSQYSSYTPVSPTNDPKGLLNITSLLLGCGFPVPAGYNGSTYVDTAMNLTISLNIGGIQVEPYIVPQYLNAPSSNSFNTPYNCEGYFSIPILMGIFSMVILLIILYLGNVFMFGMKTLDRFDDPRAPSISVDRLH